SHFFFFQAEDGIRDGHVTGVQTCALPICSLILPGRDIDDFPCGRISEPAVHAETDPANTIPRLDAGDLLRRHHRGIEYMDGIVRSEERRVGKECRAQRSAYHEKREREEPW